MSYTNNQLVEVRDFSAEHKGVFAKARIRKDELIGFFDGKAVMVDLDSRDELDVFWWRQSVHLKREGSLSGRSLEVEADYERKFVLVESQIGRRIDEALEWLREGDNGLFYDLYRNVSDKFDYLTRTRLLQALKAQEILPYLQKQLELGRKAVVFYDFNQGGSIQVFALPEGSDHTVLTFEKKRDDSGKLRYSSVPKVDQRDPAGKPFKTEETDDELRITQRDYYARARKARPDIWEISTAAPNPRDTFKRKQADVGPREWAATLLNGWIG